MLRLITIWLNEISRICGTQRSQIVSNGIEAVVRLIRARLENSKIRDARLDADWALIRRQRVLTLKVEIHFNVEIIVLLQVGIS